MKKNKLTLWNSVGYGIGSVGENIAYTVFYNFFLYFLTDLIGISATFAGVISFVAVLWDGVTDPAVGYISDNNKSPKGRRRPFILKGCFALGVAIFFMFTDLQFLPATFKGVYFLIINMLFWLFLTMTDIPYLALAAEMEATPQGRTRLRTIAAACLQGGMLLASAGMLPLANFFGKDNSLRGWSIAAAIMGACTTVAFLISVLATKGLEPENPNLKKKENGNEEVSSNAGIKDFIKSMGQLVKYKPYLILLIITFFVWFSANLQNSALMYFFSNNAGMTDDQISLQYAIIGVVCAVLSLVVGPVTNKFGKKETAFCAFSITGVLTIIMTFIKPWNITYVYLFRVLSAITLSIWYVTIYSMVYDISDLDEWENGVRRDGGMQSMFQFSIKLSTAGSMFLVGILLDHYGYNAEAAVQTESALNGIMKLTIFYPGIILLIGVVTICFYPLSNKRLHEISQLLEKRRKQEVKE